MREILFRGKRLDNGEWVYGAYHKHDTVKVCITGDDPKTKHIIIADGFCDWGFEPPLMGYEVDPSSVGQYTGLCDKNGKKIFDGDIVEVTDDFGEISSSDCGYGKVIFLNGMWYIDGDVNNGLFNLNNVYYIKVIGNKRDNPELLEGKG